MNNENEVTKVTENVEKTTEETLVDGSKDQKQVDIDTLVNNKINELLPKKLARRERKIKKEYEEKYGKLETTLKAGLEVDNIEEATNKLREFYKKNGIEIPKSKETLTDKEYEILGKSEAHETIDLGIDEVEAEASRMAQIGYENLSKKDKVIYGELAKALNYESKKKELKNQDIDTNILDKEEFNQFAKQFNKDTKIIDIYNLYNKINKKEEKKEEIHQIGSLKSSDNSKEIKSFYTYEESKKFSKKDFDENPKLFKAIENSMLKW